MSDRISFAGKVTSDGRRLRGSVTLAGSRTWRNGEWLEVDPAALVKADASDVMATIDHDPTKVMGRTRNKTLSINRHETGIDFETADLPNTTAANDALELARGDYFGGSSFAIEGLKSKFDYAEDGTRIRRITSIKRLVDVALVIDPAFANSSAAAFSKESDVPDSDPVIEPKVEPPPKTEPKTEPAKFTEKLKSGADDWAAFAADLSTEQITATLDQVFTASKADPDNQELLDRYEGFASELRNRKRTDAQAKIRVARMELEHDLTLGRVPKAPEAGLYQSDDYHEAFTKYLRTGDAKVMEQFAQAITGDGTQGGYTVPDGFLNRIVETQKAYGGVAGVADSITTSTGQPLRWPSNDDTANSAVIAAEGTAGSGGADKIFGSVELGAYSYDATGTGNVPLLVSKELIQDAAFDIEAFIARNLGVRLGRKMAADFAVGSGSSEPKGLLDKTPDTMSASTMFAATIEHIFQVDPAYRNDGNARWILSDTTLAKAYASVDGNGRPLFIPQADASAAGRPGGFIQGYPITIDNDAGDLVAFGDFRQGYIIRYVRGVQVDVDPYTNIKTRQVAFHAWARADANVQDGAAYSVSDYTGVSADS